MTEGNSKTGGRKERRQYSLNDTLKLLDEADQPGEGIGTNSTWLRGAPPGVKGP